MILENTLIRKKTFQNKNNQDKLLANYKLTNDEFMQVIKAEFTIQETERIIENLDLEYKHRKTITTKDPETKETLENVLNYLLKEKKDLGEAIYGLLENKEDTLTKEEQEIVGILSDDAIDNGIFTKKQLTEKLLALHAKTELDNLLDNLKYQKKKKLITTSDDTALLALADVIRHLEERKKYIDEILDSLESISKSFSDEVSVILASDISLAEMNRKENEIRAKYRKMNLENENK